MSKFPTILIPDEDEGGGFHLAQFFEQETALRFRRNDVPSGWKFAYQYNPEKKRITYSEKHLQKAHDAAVRQNDYDNPYASLMVRGPKDLGPILQATTIMLRVMGPSEDEASTSPTYHGTAFYVSPTIVQTARHNIQPMGNVSATRLKFRTSHNTSDSDSIAQGFKAFPIEPADDSSNLPQHLKHMIEGQGTHDIDPVDRSICKFQDDFAFLRSNRSCAKVLVPGILQASDTFVVIAGYPGAPKNADAVAAASSTLANLRHDVDLYSEELTSMVTKLGRLFREDVLNISPGAVVQSGNRISTHDCTTLPGFSGGPVIPIAAPGVFYGHHIAGTNASDAGQNLFLASTHPSYVAHYREQILPDLRQALTANSDLLTGVQEKCLLEWLQTTCDVTASERDLRRAIDVVLTQ
ncbi:hypothetical protein DFJ77DRAFT_513701 [Powellomyces hirtus]|nr:hypothetical protein DFJ77DRAFT_513701 [Powellomyces hirtus]